jgi:hypothetical protein
MTDSIQVISWNILTPTEKKNETNAHKKLR